MKPLPLVNLKKKGFIERQNRMIVEAANAMLAAKNLSGHLWREAVKTAVYLKNRTTSETINNVNK